MVFDSWAGELGPSSFKTFAEPYLATIAQKLPEKLQCLGLERVPMTVFPKGAWHALDSACDLGYNVVGMDWLHNAEEAVRIRGSRNIVFQGNADPGVLYGSKEAITRAVEEMVKGFWVGNKGWIANLGHGTHTVPIFLLPDAILANGSIIGITPGVNPDNLKHFFQEIHRLTKN
jgi:uroporphyrinogen decarboxylase